VGPRAGLDDAEKRKFLTLPGLEFQLVASYYTDYAIPAPLFSDIVSNEGKASGSEEGKLQGSDSMRGKYLSRGFTARDRNFNIKSGGLHVKHAVQRQIWLATQQLLKDRMRNHGKP
jgi:hypothetical protein